MSEPRNPDVDELFGQATRWRLEALALREILLECGLTEELKWSKPCYTHDGKNICIIQRMKGFLALMFFKGALLEDPDGVLEVQGAHSRSGYRLRYTSVDDVETKAKSVEALVRAAIAIEKAGLKVEPAAGKLEYPRELRDKFAEDPALEAAFERLTPGRQRGYILHFSDAKQAKTRAARIDKHRARIIAGRGLNDR